MVMPAKKKGIMTIMTMIVTKKMTMMTAITRIRTITVTKFGEMSKKFSLLTQVLLHSYITAESSIYNLN